MFGALTDRILTFVQSFVCRGLVLDNPSFYAAHMRELESELIFIVSFMSILANGSVVTSMIISEHAVCGAYPSGTTQIKLHRRCRLGSLVIVFGSAACCKSKYIMNYLVKLIGNLFLFENFLI